MNVHVICANHCCTFTSEELHFTHCKLETATCTILVHQHFLVLTLTLMLTFFKVIWYSIESQSGKASITVTVVVQCDGSQGNSCGEYEQQLRTTTLNPHTIVSILILLSSKAGVNQFNWGTIAMDIVSHKGTLPIVTWIVPTFSTGALSSVDRAILIYIGIL